MPLLLSLETATRAGSVCITRGLTLLASRTGSAQVSHSTHLLDQIKSALDEAGVRLREIDYFAVATGPGSFTGLRIGLATVKSFGATLHRQCVGIPTLHAVAHAAGESRRTIALLPAGRGEVFAQQFAVSSEGIVQTFDAPTHLSPHKLLDQVASIRSLRWAGEGAHAQAEAIRERAMAEGIEFRLSDYQAGISVNENQWILVKSREVLAASVAHLARLSILSGKASLPQDLHAIYVRPSDAELKEQCLD
jgi:tRNA threonylcarbamoyladenosine biosynthesis protein TsaB